VRSRPKACAEALEACPGTCNNLVRCGDGYAGIDERPKRPGFLPAARSRVATQGRGGLRPSEQVPAGTGTPAQPGPLSGLDLLRASRDLPYISRPANRFPDAGGKAYNSHAGGACRGREWEMFGSQSGRLAGATVAGFAALCALGASASVGSPAAGVPGTTTCKPFVGTKWVNPYPPHEVGKHYQVVVIGKSFTCASAKRYVVKFIAEKIKPLKLTPGIGAVTGGPVGYKCTSGISNIHTAYQGNCLARHPTPTSSSFSWGPYKDS
jgi:hypothetical protein